MPFALLPLLLNLAPTVAGWILGDKTGAAVEKVTGIAREVLGTDSPDAVEKAISTDPAAALAFKTALIQAEADARRQQHEQVLAQLADVQSARNQTVELAKAKSGLAWGAAIVSVLAVAVFAGFIYLLFVKSLPEGMKDALMLMAGAASAGFTQVLAYWLGSSAGSAQKNTLVDALARRGG